MSRNPENCQPKNNLKIMKKIDKPIKEDNNKKSGRFSTEFLQMESEKHNSTNKGKKESSSNKKDISGQIVTTNSKNIAPKKLSDKEEEKKKVKNDEKEKKSEKKKEQQNIRKEEKKEKEQEEGKDVNSKSDKNSKKNNSGENENLNDILSDDKLIKKIPILGNNKQRKNKYISCENEIDSTKNTSINIINIETQNYKDFQNDKINYNELRILNEKMRKILNKKIRKKFLFSYFSLLENRSIIDLGFKPKYYCATIVLRINLETNEIFNFNIKDLFQGELSNLDSEEKEAAKKEYDLISKMENENKKVKLKVLNILFYVKLEEIFKIYLNDCFYLKNGEAELYINKFHTFKDDFKYKPKEKEDIINCICFSLGFESPNFEKISDKIEIQQIKINHYNSRRTIINKGIQSLYSEIKDGPSDKYGIKLSAPTSKNKLGKNVNQYEEYLNKKLKYIFSELYPRRNKKGKNYSEQIDKVLKKEEEEEEENRILALLLDLVDIKSFLRAFINDEKIIKIKDNNGNEFNLYLPNLKTFKDCFGYLPKEIMEDIKKDFINFLDGKIKPRKSSELRNSKLKNNKNLTGRKRNRSN